MRCPFFVVLSLPTIDSAPKTKYTASKLLRSLLASPKKLYTVILRCVAA